MAQYLDLDTILMEQEAVPSEMRTDIIKLGHLNPSTPGQDLKQGAHVDLPLWLAEKLKVIALLSLLAMICTPLPNACLG